MSLFKFILCVFLKLSYVNRRASAYDSYVVLFADVCKYYLYFDCVLFMVLCYINGFFCDMIVLFVVSVCVVYVFCFECVVASMKNVFLVLYVGMFFDVFV